MVRATFNLDTEENIAIYKMLKRLALLDVKVMTLWRKYNPENKMPPNFSPEIKAEFGKLKTKMKSIETNLPCLQKSGQRWKSTFTFKDRSLIVYINPKTGKQCRRPTLNHLLYEYDNWEKVVGFKDWSLKSYHEHNKEITRKWIIDSYDSF